MGTWGATGSRPRQRITHKDGCPRGGRRGIRVRDLSDAIPGPGLGNDEGDVLVASSVRRAAFEPSARVDLWLVTRDLGSRVFADLLARR